MDTHTLGMIYYCVGMIEATKAQVVAMQYEDAQPNAVKRNPQEYYDAAALIGSFANDIATYARS